MADQHDVLVIGAGAAGLMAALELAQAGRRVSVIEARERCGGRIATLSAAEWGYPAEPGAEFVHGAAPLTHDLLRQAGLLTSPVSGRRWRSEHDILVPSEIGPWEERYRDAMVALKTDMPVGEFLRATFPGDEYAGLRRAVTRETEGYNAADVERFSTFAMRDQWLDPDSDRQTRVVEGYGALIGFLAGRCRGRGAAIHLSRPVASLAIDGDRVTARCRDGSTFAAAAAVVAVPLPVLPDIVLPPPLQTKVAAALPLMGFGKVVKMHLRFTAPWWLELRPDFADLGFMATETQVLTWWTQYPAPHPVLTAWHSGPHFAGAAALPADELVERGLVSLSRTFGRPLDRLKAELAAARVTDWGNDPFARNGYSYMTPQSRPVQLGLREPTAGRLFLAGEALYIDGEGGTVEAALASGRETARLVLDKR